MSSLKAPETGKHLYLLKTAPNDIRFSNSCNQAKHCFTLYNALIRCEIKNGYNAPECEKVTANTLSMCPKGWLDEWHEQRELGNFVGISHPPPPKEDDSEFPEGFSRYA